MPNTATPTRSTLSPEWVDQILVTAFDGHYGGCWHWVNIEDDVIKVRTASHTDAWGVEHLTKARIWFRAEPEDDLYEADGLLPELRPSEREGLVYVDLTAAELDKAVTKIMGDDHLSKTDTGQQIRQARKDARDGLDGAPDLDAEAADVIVQVALFGKIVFG